MRKLPRDKAWDSTIAMLRDPYGRISKVCGELGCDAYRTRVLGRPAVCMSGPAAAALFYDPSRFHRRGAMPRAIRRTLLGEGGVQGLDGEEHRHRKAMLMSLMTPDRIRSLTALINQRWTTAAARWQGQHRVVLFDESCDLLARSVCEWAGVPLPEREADRRVRQLRLLFDGAGAVGLRHLRSRWARRQADRWAASVVARVRAGDLDPPQGSAARVISFHRDLEGSLLDARVAGVDLLNILRPVVAIAVYITWIAHALHEHPECRGPIERGEEGAAERLVQEVRRFYPFFPMVAARVSNAFAWEGYRFATGTRVLLDLHGTNRDARSWQEPDAFRPSRFETWRGDPFSLIPQGGGDHAQHHRCAGEWLTIAVMQGAAEFLIGQMSYTVPSQDLRIDWSRLPALPKSRLVMSDITVRPSPLRATAPSGCPARVALAKNERPPQQRGP